MAKDQVSVEISIEEKAALKALTALTRGVDKFEKEAKQSIGAVDKSLSVFKGTLGAIATAGAFKAIANGLGSLIGGSVEAAASAEKISTQLEVLTGSAEAASSLFKELTDFSATTPFQLQGIAEASAQLLSFGFEAESVTERIGKIGEVAAGSNSDLKEVALIYGQVAAAGKLTGERLLQFQERAVPIGAALAESLGVAESEVKELVSAGVVGFPEFEKAFNSMSEAGGIFEGAIAKQSQTLSGVVSTMKDNFFILQQTIGDTFRADLVDGAQVIIVALQDITKAIVSNKDIISDAIGFVKDYIGVYANFAVDLAKAETPLDKVNEKLLEQDELLTDLKARKKELESDKGALFGIFDAATEQSIKKINSQIYNAEAALKRVVEERKKVLADEQKEQPKDAEATTDPAANPRVKAEAEVSKKILDERKMLQLELEMLEQERLQKEAEAKLAQGELNSEQRTVELEFIKEHESEKARIASEMQALKDTSIRDAELASLAAQKRNAQEEIAIAQAKAKAKKAIAEQEEAVLMKQVEGFGKATSMAASIAQKGTAEQKALSIASATINTYAAATRAFKDYPAPANFAVMAATIAAGLNTVSKIQAQSFQSGGVVGGFSGATNGTDNTTANVRTGEMVLNGSQQRQLFDVANGRGGEDNTPKVIELTSIVQVDEREIARAVRNQRLEGFAI